MSCNLSYISSITGDCSNLNVGSFTIDIYGSAPDYSIQWIDPIISGGTISLGAGVTSYTENNLSAGTYTFNLIDSCIPNTILPINIYISSGTCISLSGLENTLCGFNNGSITATTSNFYGSAQFYLYENTLGYITSATSITDSYTFGSLTAGTYYVVANDGGGCTGKSETCIVKSSTTVDYGLYIIDDAGCAVNSGKIFITGLTGNPPYTYLWSNGDMTSSITGLTPGSYSVTVTDNTGCQISKSGIVNQVLPVGFGAFTVVNPSCYASDGEVTIIVTGGTAPYYYSGSNGSIEISFSNSVTFTNIGAGLFSVSVTDAGLCSFVASTSILTPASFSVVSIGSNNSTCNNSSGSISPIQIFGGSPPYTYTLINPTGGTLSQTTNSASWQFDGLSSGVYTLQIEDGGPCIFTNTYTIENEILFDLIITPSGTTCGGSNGSVTIDVSGGTPPYEYVVGIQTLTSSFSSQTFNNLSSGVNVVTVTDDSGCPQTQTFFVNPSNNVDFTLLSTDSTNGSNGTISAFITSGEPTFTLEWSSNVNGQTGSTLSNLSAGTYTLKITDSFGCVKQRSVVINGTSSLSSYQVYNVCDSDFANTGVLLKKGPRQMLNEGYYDLTFDDDNCILNSSVFEASVSVSGVTLVESFYTGYTLTDYPTNQEWYDVITTLLLDFDGIGDVVISDETNKITITTDCNSDVNLSDASVVINLIIHYNISCVSCG